MTKKIDPIRIGLVGLGRAGLGMHTVELKGKERLFKIVAACDLIKERRDTMAGTYGCKTYARIEELIADPDVELVDIATRSCDHFRHALLALKAGKIVFLDKPFGIDYNEAKKLAAAARTARSPLFLRHNRRFGAAFNRVQKVIASGVLGAVYDVRIEAGSYQRRNDWQAIKRFGGGLLNNWGPHLVDEALQFLEAPVKQITSDLKQVAAVGDTEDHFRIFLKGTNERTVQLQVSNGTLIPTSRFIVHGTRGVVTVNAIETEMWLKYIDPRQTLRPIQADPSTPGVKAAFGNAEKLRWIEKTIPIKSVAGMDGAQIWVALYEAIRLRKKFPITMEGSLEVMRILSLAKKGQKIKDWRG